jgi:hypothetical protein
MWRPYPARSPGLIAVRAAGKPDLEGDNDAGQPVTVSIADLVRASPHLEPVRFGPARGEDVDVDRGAAGNGSQQQFGRGEAGIAAGAEPGLAAADVGDREHALVTRSTVTGAVRSTISHTHALPGNRMASRAAGLRPRQNPYT